MKPEIIVKVTTPDGARRIGFNLTQRYVIGKSGRWKRDRDLWWEEKQLVAEIAKLKGE